MIIKTLTSQEQVTRIIKTFVSGSASRITNTANAVTPISIHRKPEIPTTELMMTGMN